MNESWTSAVLGEVVRHRKEFIEISDVETYKRCRVKLHAQGIVLRDIVSGMEVKTKRQQVCRAGEFLVAEIDAKVGGFGIVPEELENAIVSSHYFLFEIDEARLDRRFLDYFIRTPAFREQVQAQGSTNYAAVRPLEVLNYNMPLPSLDEQQRIVRQIDELATKIEEARKLREEVNEECNALCRSIIFDEAEETTPTAMRELVRWKATDVSVNRDETYHFAGVYCFGKGVFKGHRKAGMEFAYSRLSRLQTGNFVYPKLMAWEGALGVVPPECDGLVVSPEFPVFEIDESRVLPEVLDVYFRTPSVWSKLSATSTGTNVRRRRLNPPDFLSFKMPLPSMAAQHKLREVKRGVDAIKIMQSETATAFDALLPSVLDKAFKGEL